jgi:hypothetical protein
MKNFSFLPKKSVATLTDIPDRTRLYAKTSHFRIRYPPGIRRILPAFCNGDAILGANSEI